jgi:superfamily II DNA or RNA helicase
MLQARLPVEWSQRPPVPNPLVAGHDVRSKAETLVALFFSDLSDGLKKITFQQFLDGQCKILIATDAFGAGMDIPTIQRVVQWGASGLEDLDSLVQRFGRCARDPNIQGMCILYHEQSYVGDRREEDDSQPQPKKRKRSKVSEPQQQQRQKRTPLDMRTDMDIGLWAFINPVRSNCRRQEILQYYSDPALEDDSEILASAPCCDLDSGDQITEYSCAYGCQEFPRTDEIQPSSNTVGRSRGAPPRVRTAVETALKAWRKQKHQSDWAALGLFTPQWIMTDKLLSTLTANATRIHDVSSMTAIAGFSWDRGHCTRYGGC